MKYHIRRAGVADAEAFTRCHIECLAETYRTIMPAEFAEQYWRDFAQHCDDHRQALQRCEQAEANGEVPHRRFWVAYSQTDSEQNFVGLASSGPGKAFWDTEERPELPVSFNFDMLYTRAETHGSGLGQRLLDSCLPNYQPAYLWILRGNPRAEAMYLRNGFIADDHETRCGDYWFFKPMFRMYRTQEMAETSRQAMQGPTAASRTTPVTCIDHS